VKIRFIERPPARDYKVGDIVEFNGHIAEGYARKYILRGWAVEYVAPVVEVAKPVEKVVVKAPEPKATLSLKPKDPEPAATEK